MFNISKTNKQNSKPFFFFWKLRSICKFWIQNQFCAILGGWDICKTKPGSEIDKYIFILTWSGPHCLRVALRCPDWPLSGPDTPWETSWGNLGPLRASWDMTRPARASQGLFVLWGPLRSVWIGTCLLENPILFCKHLSPIKLHKIGFVFNIYIWISVFRRKKRCWNPFIGSGDIKQTNIWAFFSKRPVCVVYILFCIV